jgi:hypothetical protein
MGLSTTIFKCEEDAPFTGASLKALVNGGTLHDDTPIMIKIGEALVHVREWRHVTVGEGAAKVLVPVDFPFITK